MCRSGNGATPLTLTLLNFLRDSNCRISRSEHFVVEVACCGIGAIDRHPGLPELLSSKERNTRFEAVALPNLKALHRKAWCLLRDPSAADDMVQETCLRAWQRFDEFTPGTNARAWLFAILMNVIRHEYRHRGRWQMDSQSQEILENCAAPPTLYAELLTGQHLLCAIDGLPALSRDVLLLAVDSDLRYHEIAEALQIPIGTVMSRLSRARAQLRSQVMGSARYVSAAVSTTA
jgi:RNA polymerase sigma factor (sigma-70 family)